MADDVRAGGAAVVGEAARTIAQTRGSATLGPIVAAERVAGRDDVVFADVRWYLDGRSGYDAYVTQHIAGAVFVSLDEHLAAPPSAEAGRHPLPSADAFAASLGSLGIGEHDVVVAYDDSGGMSAARLVWMLRVIGCDAALLDGGLAAWSGALEAGPPPARPSVERRSVAWPDEAIVSADEAGEVAAAAHGIVFDARAAERFRGDVEPIDPRAGHIPGALNAPWSANLSDDGKFRPPAELRAHYEGADADAAEGAIVYCGSGVSACVDLLALEFAFGHAGHKLYPGSWSQWSADAARPVATGV